MKLLRLSAMSVFVFILHGAHAAVSVQVDVDLAGTRFHEPAGGATITATFINEWAAVHAPYGFITSPDYDVEVTKSDAYVRALTSPTGLSTIITGSPPSQGSESLAAYTQTLLDLGYQSNRLEISVPYTYSISRQSLHEQAYIDLFAIEPGEWEAHLANAVLRFTGDELHREGSGWLDIVLDSERLGHKVHTLTISNHTYAWISTPVPEPGTWALMGTGLLGMLVMWRRARRG